MKKKRYLIDAIIQSSDTEIFLSLASQTGERA